MSTTKQKVASFVGILPGPRNGMTSSTLQVVNQLNDACQLRKFDIGKSFKSTGISWTIRKLFASVRSVFSIMSWKCRDNENIYLIGNSTSGLFYNIGQAWIARRKGFRCVLHHHVYHYIEKYDRRMQLLLRVIGDNGLHVMACQRMVDEFNTTYSTNVKHIVVPPAIVKPVATLTKRPHETFTIGHLSNLSVSKGLKEVIEAYAELDARKIDARLILAGPLGSSDAKTLIEDAIEKFGDRVRYLGPVYDADKAQFFADIDVFVFPTKIESWGIVLNESLAAGVPVITVDRGCISCLVSDGGCVLDPGADFSQNAANQIEQWIQKPQSYSAAAARSVSRGVELKDQSSIAFAELVRAIVN